MASAFKGLADRRGEGQTHTQVAASGSCGPSFHKEQTRGHSLACVWTGADGGSSREWLVVQAVMTFSWGRWGAGEGCQAGSHTTPHCLMITLM